MNFLNKFLVIKLVDDGYHGSFINGILYINQNLNEIKNFEGELNDD